MCFRPLQQPAGLTPNGGGAGGDPTRLGAPGVPLRKELPRSRRLQLPCPDLASDSLVAFRKGAGSDPGSARRCEQPGSEAQRPGGHDRFQVVDEQPGRPQRIITLSTRRTPRACPPGGLGHTPAAGLQDRGKPTRLPIGRPERLRRSSAMSGSSSAASGSSRCDSSASRTNPNSVVAQTQRPHQDG